MDRKIIAVMLTLVVVAVVVMAFVLVAAGGIRASTSGGFTKLFDELQNPSGALVDQELTLPTSWHVNDIKKVSDRIVDMYYDTVPVASTTVYITTLYFAYSGEKWNNPEEDGTNFYVPYGNGWMHISHGLFHIQVSTATNLSAEYQPGDVIELESPIATNTSAQLVFGEWSVVDTQ